MSKTHLVLEFNNKLTKLIESAKELHIQKTQIDEVFYECLCLLNGKENHDREDRQSPPPFTNMERNKKHNNNRFDVALLTLMKIVLLSSIIAISIYILLNFHQPTASLVLRNVQSLIYPSLKFLRYLSVPIIQKFPSLTDLYDESCLLENPYFYVHDMECWPCNNVYSISITKEYSNETLYPSGNPYLTKTSHQPVPFIVLKKFYQENKDIFNNEANNIKSSSHKINSLEELFLQHQEVDLSKMHILWRINKMLPARILRNLFPKPEAMPERCGQSVERFITIDGFNAPPYPFPNTECSYISVWQASGHRTVVLKPSPECTHECRQLSITLQPSDILWYNWWYWRPISLPVNKSTSTSVAYISSYC